MSRSSPGRPRSLASSPSCSPASSRAAAASGSDGNRPPPPAAVRGGERLPDGRGKTTIGASSGAAQGPRSRPASRSSTRARNRFGFALFDRARKQINGAAVALYTASADGSGRAGPVPGAQRVAGGQAAVRAPRPARRTPTRPSRSTSPTCRSRRQGPQRWSSPWRGSTGAWWPRRRPAPIAGRAGPGPPRAGEKAIKVDTPTKRERHRRRLEDRHARSRPTPCTTSTSPTCSARSRSSSCSRRRSCARAACAARSSTTSSSSSRSAATRPTSSTWRSTTTTTSPRATARRSSAWRLPSEPWTFVIGKDGRVKARFEGALLGRRARARARVGRPELSRGARGRRVGETAPRSWSSGCSAPRCLGGWLVAGGETGGDREARGVRAGAAREPLPAGPPCRRRGGARAARPARSGQRPGGRWPRGSSASSTPRSSLARGRAAGRGGGRRVGRAGATAWGARARCPTVPARG